LLHFRPLIVSIAALSLAACAGGVNGSAPPVQSSQGSAQGAVRHTRSGCTPDSYGYCAVLVSNTVTFDHCPRGGSVFGYLAGQKKYAIYQNTTFLDNYTETFNGDCVTGQYDPTWDNGDPAVVYSDPNLP
jgi:hypothetical protein